ncbi:hypothetical protein [Paenibacillus sp. FJAT-26967]|uniref:hypothetical protein n=1 Tax=Paenibacillus sp. FJAT-26967 TaxID=1729690 RepID=UPI000837AF0B|nr:hypothetical protein [Paenibacillus sp. FJAT-26967]
MPVWVQRFRVPARSSGYAVQRGYVKMAKAKSYLPETRIQANDRAGIAAAVITSVRHNTVRSGTTWCAGSSGSGFLTCEAVMDLRVFLTLPA